MTRWEYLTVASDEPLDDDRLCEYGALGWLLCAEMKAFVGRGYVARFARPVKGDDAIELPPRGLPAEVAGETREIGHCRGPQQ